jgi:hypothetical protein
MINFVNFSIDKKEDTWSCLELIKPEYSFLNFPFERLIVLTLF